MDKSDFTVDKQEAALILSKAKDIWNYDRNKYWGPLATEDVIYNFEWFFITEGYLADYYKRIVKLLFIRSDMIYYVPLSGIDENIYKFDSDLFNKFKDDCTEYTCFPDNVSWIYYRGHESTVAFAGTIYNQMRKILSAVKNKWNIYEGG